MRVRKMTINPRKTAIATSSIAHGIASDWIAIFIVDPGLDFVVGDQVTAIPTPWAGAMMGGRVLGYYGGAEGGLNFLDIKVDSAIGQGDEIYSAWEIFRFGGDDDFRFGAGQGDYYRDAPEGVAQIILTRLRLYRGDWFLDLEEGTPWYEAVLGKGTKQKIEPALRARILGTPSVKAIETFDVSIDPDTRALSISAEVSTDFGPVTLEGVL